MGSIINKVATKKFILAKTDRLRPGWDCTRVSESFLNEAEAYLRAYIIGRVRQHPTLGKTFRP